MKPDTQKTTKAVREAPAASEYPLDALKARAHAFKAAQTKGDTERMEALAREAREESNRADSSALHGELISKPHTVELTTEGWQIKDNVKGTIKANCYAEKRWAEEQAEVWNKDGRVVTQRIDDAEGQGRR